MTKPNEGWPEGTPPAPAVIPPVVATAPPVGNTPPPPEVEAVPNVEHVPLEVMQPFSIKMLSTKEGAAEASVIAKAAQAEAKANVVKAKLALEAAEKEAEKYSGDFIADISDQDFNECRANAKEIDARIRKEKLDMQAQIDAHMASFKPVV